MEILAIIGGKLFSNSPNNNNHVYKDENDFLLVVITLGTNVSGGDTFFYDRFRIYTLGIRARVFNFLHGKFIAGPFEELFDKVRRSSPY